MTAKGKIVFTLLFLAVVGFGVWKWWDKLAPRHATVVQSAGGAPTAAADNAPAAIPAATTPAKEVVAQAAKKGLKLSENYVYTIRSSGSKAKKAGKPGPKPGRKGKAGSDGMTPAEAQLRNAIADLGLVKATEILEAVKATIKGR